MRLRARDERVPENRVGGVCAIVVQCDKHRLDCASRPVARVLFGLGKQRGLERGDGSESRFARALAFARTEPVTGGGPRKVST